MLLCHVMWFSPLAVVCLQTRQRKIFYRQIKLKIIWFWSSADQSGHPDSSLHGSNIYSVSQFYLLSSFSFSNQLLYFSMYVKINCVPCGTVHRAEAKAEGPKTQNCFTEVASGLHCVNCVPHSKLRSSDVCMDFIIWLHISLRLSHGPI